MKHHNLSGQPVLVFEKQKLTYCDCCQLVLVTLALSLSTVLKRACLPLLHFLQPAFIHPGEAPLSLVFCTLSGQALSDFLKWKVPQSQGHLCVPTLNLFQYMHVFPILGRAELNPALKVWPHQCWGEGFTSINLLVTILLVQPRRLLANSLRRPIKTSVSINQGVKAKNRTHFQKPWQLNYNQKDICRVTCWWAVLLRLAKVIQITYSKILLQQDTRYEVNSIQKIHMHLRLLLVTVKSSLW